MDGLQPPSAAAAETESGKLLSSLSKLYRWLRERSQLLPTGALIALFLVLLTLLFARFTFVFHVIVDGEVVGQVPDRQMLEELVYTAEGTVTNILGEPFYMAERVSYRIGLLSAAEAEHLDTHAVKRGIYEHIEEIDVSYVISVDGVTVGYIAELSPLRTAMDQRLAHYMENGALSAVFLSDVEFEFQFVDVDEKLDAEYINQLVESLSVETVEHITYRETVPYTVEIVQDHERFIDDSQVLREGMDGEVEIIAELTSVDGREIQRTIFREVVLTDAVSEIVIEGTLERPPTASYGYYIWPVAGRVSSPFGPRNVSIGSSNHQGIDIAAPAGEMVFAADGGEVIFTGWSGGFGNLIKIRHDNGHVTYYAHLSSIDVSRGERVYRGQFIGRVGMTGTASGNHLHFEIRINGVPVDPMPFLP